MPDLRRRARIALAGAVVWGLLGMASLVLFYFNGKAGTFALTNSSAALLWIGLLFSPLLWLECTIPWAAAAAPIRRIYLLGSCLILPALTAVAVSLLRRYPNSFDAIVEPIGNVWLISLFGRGVWVYWLSEKRKRTSPGAPTS